MYNYIMIHFYFGENDFAIKRQVDDVTKKFIDKYGTESVTKIDTSTTDPQKLLAEIVNTSLFALNRLIILLDAGSNKSSWEVLGENLSRVPDEIELIVVEPSPDKRTKTFKELKKRAKVREFNLPKNRDLTEFVLGEAADNKIEIKRDAVAELIIFTGGDPWRITSEITKFKTLNKLVTSELIHELVEPELEASAFQLLDDLLSGKRDKALNELAKLRKVEDANRFLGLLASQVFALSAAVNAGGKNSASVASDMGVHPFVMGKMFAVAKRINQTDIKRISEIVAKTDVKIKSSGVDPWTLIELALSKI